MEGITELVRIVLIPARYVAEQIGLPAELPTVELSVGLVFLAACSGLSLLAFYHWLRSKHLILLVSSLIAFAAGVIGLLVTITSAHAWLYTLILSIVAADAYWRLTTKTDLPRTIKRAGILWAAAALVLCAGTPALFVVHTWLSGQRADTTLSRTLRGEHELLVTTQQKRITEAVTKLAQSAELTSSTFTVGDPLLVALVQRMAIEENLPYLVILDDSTKVLARSQPVAAFGDTWPVQLAGINTGTTSGVTISERGVPLIVSARPITVGTTENAYILVGGIFIDQTYITTRSSELQQPLFLSTSQGVISLAAPEGKALNALSSESIDTELAKRSDGATSFSLESQGSRYLVRTLPFLSTAGKPIGALGSATIDTSSDFRLRLDFVAIIALAVLVLVLPAIVWRRKGVTS